MFSDYVTRRFNASSAELKKLVGLDLRWNRRLRNYQIQLEPLVPRGTGLQFMPSTIQPQQKYENKNYLIHRVSAFRLRGSLRAGHHVDSGESHEQGTLILLGR